jgi:gliding motility-associated lipoprotein GldH
MKINPLHKALVIFCFVSLSSCNSKIIFSEYHTFKNEEWSSTEKAEFEVEIKDNQCLNNVSLMVRHADAYPYNNIFLLVTSKYPDGKITKDTMEVVLANDKGEWLGSGAGDLFDLKIPIKKNVRFPLLGKYNFTFEQVMRETTLPLILDFGFEIEKSN